MADIKPTRSPGWIPAAIRPAATAVTRSANCSAVTGCHMPPAFTANIVRPGSLAQSKTSSRALPPMNHHLYQSDVVAPACPDRSGPPGTKGPQKSPAQAPGRPHHRAMRPAGPARRRHEDRPPAAGERAVRRPARLQPGPHAVYANRRVAVAAPRQRRGADRAAVLPGPHRRAVPPRAGHRVHHSCGDGADRRIDLSDARPPVLLPGAGRARLARTRRDGEESTSGGSGVRPASRPRDGHA